MTTFETKRHVKVDESYQGFNLTEFTIEGAEQIDNEQIVDTFLRTKHFSYDSLRDCIKKEPEKGYLRQAFDIERIKISDFKKTDKKGIIKFLSEFINEPDWGDDRNEFAKLVDRYLEIYNDLSENEFYMLSKDWFDKDDERLIKPESWCYTYYFLIISVNRNTRTLTLTEWTYD